MMGASLKLLLGVVILTLCLLAHYALDYQARYAELRQLDENLVRMQSKLEDYKTRLRRLPELTEEMQALERELTWADGPKEEDPELLVSHYLEDVERLVQAQDNYNFRIQAVVPGDATGGTEDSPIVGRSFSLKMKGEYATLADFLEELADLKLDRLVTIDRIDLSPAEGNVLNITLPMTAYLRG